MVLSLAPTGFSPGTPVFPSPRKPIFPNSNSTRNDKRRITMRICYILNAIYLFIYLFISLEFFVGCQCSIAGSLSSACHMTTGECSCKSNVEGSNCDICKSGTFNLDSGNHQGCLHCFGYFRAIRCSSATGFVASTITSQFVNETGILQ